MKIALGIEYDGSPFSGWERQIGRDTVQSQVEAAISKVANHPVRTVCAGRTDAGVHALGQVVHFESEAQRGQRSWVLGANSNLPPEVAVRWALQVDDSFHARFSARRRRYRYAIFNRPVRSAVSFGRLTWECRALDVARMQAAAAFLVGEHDFSSYRSLACQAKNPVRTIHRLDVTREGELVFLDVVANAFLHHMVRNIAGVLMAIGTGKHEPRWATEVLAARDRRQGGVTARPDGLYLVGVEYPQRFGIPTPVTTPLVY